MSRSTTRATALALSQLLLLLLLLITACGITQVPTHQTYSYTFTGLPQNRLTNPDEPAHIYQLGEQLELTWNAQPGPEVPATEPQPVSIEVGLVGPFASLEDLHAALSFDNSTIKGPVTLTMEPIKTDNWAGKRITANLSLSDPVTPGYYMLVQRTLVGDQGPSELLPTGNILHINQ